ncbi:hypothetical protein GSY69_00795 [Brevibacterium sp. 5221]|uniref:Uncharacterized protein n=1 Tax=Brevibacterium rongguiense TaxID=2695267 RepID=A0A6N9H3Z4_9MICO|nr:hypothetical protein [Brevibacterium rongguiense]MYM18551.1 hypothetical protein [Brevibacterium rongguiense]
MKLLTVRAPRLTTALCALLLAAGGSALASTAEPAVAAQPASAAVAEHAAQAAGLPSAEPLAKKTQPGLGGGPGEAPTQEQSTDSDDGEGRTRVIVIFALLLGAVGIGLTVWAFLTWRRGDARPRGRGQRPAGDQARGGQVRDGQARTGQDGAAAPPQVSAEHRARSQKPGRKH